MALLVGLNFIRLAAGQRGKDFIQVLADAKLHISSLS
jgi:hypothetical protein